MDQENTNDDEIPRLVQVEDRSETVSNSPSGEADLEKMKNIALFARKTLVVAIIVCWFSSIAMYSLSGDYGAAALTVAWFLFGFSFSSAFTDLLEEWQKN